MRGKKERLPVLISYGDEVYRPAGYRVPLIGEKYVGKDGRLRTRTCDTMPADGIRLIVRVYDGDNDFKS